MNKDKLEAMYELGMVLKGAGKEEESVDQFKLIYQEDVSYRDIQEIMDEFYQKKWNGNSKKG